MEKLKKMQREIKHDIHLGGLSILSHVLKLLNKLISKFSNAESKLTKLKTSILGGINKIVVI